MHLAIGAALVAVVLSGPALPQRSIACPPTIQVVQKGEGLEAPWSAEEFDEDGRHSLMAAVVFEGPPHERRALRPQAAKGRTTEGRLVQSFRWDVPPPEGVYLGCSYDGTTVIAQRRVEPTPHRCSLETFRGAKGFGPAVLTCD
jgi:hypothetical protein